MIKGSTIHTTSLVVLILLFSHQYIPIHAGTPAPALFYRHQLVNHDDPCDSRRWSQRYYVSDKHWQGPGHPLFVILGGEGNIEPSKGLLYPFVTNFLAKDLGAIVLQPEHRFYGQSQPTTNLTERSVLLTPKQALQDAMRLIRIHQSKLHCSLHKNSTSYCPVVTIGGSYPGWLSAMARLVFPDVIDMAYAASAPIKFYAQQVDPNAYYQHIANVANLASHGCTKYVQTALTIVEQVAQILPDSDLQNLATSLGWCCDSLPHYITTVKLLVQETFMVIAYTFANLNMAYYPPNTTTAGLYQACQVFSSTQLDPVQKIQSFLQNTLGMTKNQCVDMSLQLPTGPRATLSAGDWSGVGPGPSGESWDFQTCSLLVEPISLTGLIPQRNWTYEWLHQHCRQRFDVIPQPFQLVHDWHFDDFGNHTSHILFTNGLNDGWFVGGLMENVSDTLVVLNFPNGAHHSDLSGTGPSDRDTPDVVQGFGQITQLLVDWLNEIHPGRFSVTKATSLVRGRGGAPLRTNRREQGQTKYLY